MSDWGYEMALPQLGCFESLLAGEWLESWVSLQRLRDRFHRGSRTLDHRSGSLYKDIKLYEVDVSDFCAEALKSYNGERIFKFHGWSYKLRR